jgi:hypothetical protein
MKGSVPQGSSTAQFGKLITLSVDANDQIKMNERESGYFTEHDLAIAVLEVFAEV